MRIGKFEHKPSSAIVLIFLLFLAALVFLGSWQMQRAATKTSILAAAAESRSEAPVSPMDISDVELAANEHTRLKFDGTYLGDYQFLWDNRVYKGQAGYEVITPVQTDAGIVLVNRGWVAPGETRQVLPNVALSIKQLEETITTTGLFSRPSKGFASGSAFDDNAAWPRVLSYFDYELISEALGAEVLAGVVQPQRKYSAEDATWNPGTETIGTEETAVARPEYFTANWEPAASIGPARHYGYAFQWYAMAVALSILYIVYNTKRIEQKA